MNDLDQKDLPSTDGSNAPKADDIKPRVDAMPQEYLDASTASEQHASFEGQISSESSQLQPTGASVAIQSADIIREQDKIQLILSYLFPFVPFFTVKDSDYVQWHAKQGLALWITCVAGSILLGVIPLIGCFAAPLFGIAVTIACIKGLLEAFKPARWEIPLVSSIAQKLFG